MEKAMKDWQSDPDATPALRDVEFMAATLEARHGCHAKDVAGFFASLHDVQGDAGRSWAWAGVAKCVRQREKGRLISGA